MTEIIPEAGINHNGVIDVAKEQIYEATRAGAKKIKFQVYHTDKLYNGDKSAPTYKDSERAELHDYEHEGLARYCRDEGIEYFATPFDTEAVSLLERIGVKHYKVASRSITNLTLLKRIALTKKPVIMSCGNHPYDKIDEAIETLNGNIEVLLYCVPLYPAPPEKVNLKEMHTLRKTFNFPVGFSDHTIGIDIATEALKEGAVLIEKHFTTDRTLPGCDQKCSIEPYELKELIRRANENHLLGR